MADIEIKRGYEVLPDNNVRFGIRVINNSSSVISEVEVLLDYSEDSFKLQGDKIQKLGTIPPSVPRTAKFVLQPKGCIHKEEVGATVLYKDHAWIKHVEQMHPKEVHCVCPFLKEKSISRAEFLVLSNSGYSAESGVNFENIDSGRVVELLSHTCKNRLYKVDEFSVDGGSILYLAGDAVGEKAYYLLTAVIKEHEGVTQVFLRANSDKDHGLTGFLNETLDNLHHLVVVGKVREIGIIRKEQVINIIDSIVQRTSFGRAGGEGAANVNIEGSLVQRTEFNAGEGRKVEEEPLRGEREEQLELEKRKAQEEKKRQDGRNIWENSKRVLENQIEVRCNTIGMKFTLIQAGEFMMGAPLYVEERLCEEGPVHKVNIRNSFYLGTYPVTQREWKVVMGNNPSRFKGDDLPVDQVSWDDVQKFIKKLNDKEGTDKYRLPSEAEWEYSCRAGTTTKYCFGDSESKLGEYAWYDDNSGDTTHPVGQKKPNSWGLYDMHGNSEWVQDEMHDNYTGAPSDGSAWESGDDSARVARGGGWGLEAEFCRSASRYYDEPDFRDAIGFRLLQET